ncbi:hypothetical protein ABPG74_011487 [Tetrahymena malaccensis]
MFLRKLLCTQKKFTNPLLINSYRFSTQTQQKGRKRSHNNNQQNQYAQQQQQQQFQQQQQTINKQDAEKQKKSEEDEDIHAKRFAETLKIESAESPKEGEVEEIKEKRQSSRFIFNSSFNSIQIPLDDVNIINIENEQTFHRVPKLMHNLDQVVYKPGLYKLEDIAQLQPDGGEFLKYIPQPDEIDFDRIPPYIPPSNDKLLLDFAKQSNIRYVMSTSTISNVLSQIYFLFSSFRNPSFDNISSAYDQEPKKYMISQRKPTSNMLRKLDPKNGIYALDSDSGLFETPNQILMDLGKVMERQLTLDPETFRNGLLKNSPVKEQLIDDDHHRFMKLNKNICLRSQIDCQANDPKTGQPFVFEIKTRAVCPIRYDLNNYLDHIDYRINTKFGLHSSFEREYYDLIRGAMLKYAFQLKIGRMDGAFIAYHNTKEIFGFEYVKTKEIEARCFGNQFYADASFVICSKILTNLLDHILNDLENEKYEMLKIGFYSDSPTKKMIIFVELFPEQTKWDEKKNLLKPTDDVKDEFDYYTKYKKLTNKVLKYEYQIFPFINGVLAKSNNYSLMPGDQIEVKYKFKKIGKPAFLDYMNFLHEAYKFETMNLDLSYIGAWVK